MQNVSILPNECTSYRLSASEMIIFVLLSSFKDGSKISYERLSHLSGLSRYTVIKSVELLVGRGIICKRSVIKNGRYTANRYKVLCRAHGRHFFVMPLSPIGRVSPYAYLVYVYLYCHAGWSKKAYPSEYQIAKDLGISRTTVRKASMELESKGEISRERRFYQKAKATKAYRSFAYSIVQRCKKIDPQILPVCVEKGFVKVETLEVIFGLKWADFALIGDLRNLCRDFEVIRPPKSPNLPP